MAAPENCPNCGADVPRNAKSCPECGACEQTGWSEAAATSGLGLPDDDFDYDEFIEKEFGGRKRRQPGAAWFWWIVGAALTVIFLIMIFWWR